MARSRISAPVIKRTIQTARVVVHSTIIKTVVAAETTCAAIICWVDVTAQIIASVRGMTRADEATTNNRHSRNSRTVCLIMRMNVHSHISSATSTRSHSNRITILKRSLPASRAQAAKAANSLTREKGAYTHLYRRLQLREITQIDEVGVAPATVALRRPKLRGLESHLTSPGVGTY